MIASLLVYKIGCLFADRLLHDSWARHSSCLAIEHVRHSCCWSRFRNSNESLRYFEGTGRAQPTARPKASTNHNNAWMAGTSPAMTKRKVKISNIGEGVERV